MADLERGEKIMLSPAEGTWFFGRKLLDSLGRRNLVVDKGDELGHVDYYRVYAEDIIDKERTAVEAPYRAFVKEVFTPHGEYVRAGTPLLLMKALYEPD